MTAHSTEDEQIDETIRHRLSDARERLADVEEGAAPPEEIRSIAEEVDDLLSSGDTAALLEAAGVDLPDDSEPASVPEAIMHGDPKSVADLRSILLLAELSEQRDAEASTSILDELRRLGRMASGDAGTEGGGDAQPSTEGEGGAESGDDSEDGSSAVEDAIRSTFGNAIREFREGIETARSGLPDEDGEDGRSVIAGGAEDADAGVGSSSGSTHVSTGPSGRTSRVSTMPPSERRDMEQPARLSTLPPNSRRRRG